MTFNDLDCAFSPFFVSCKLSLLASSLKFSILFFSNSQETVVVTFLAFASEYINVSSVPVLSSSLNSNSLRSLFVVRSSPRSSLSPSLLFVTAVEA